MKDLRRIALPIVFVWASLAWPVPGPGAEDLDSASAGPGAQKARVCAVGSNQGVDPLASLLAAAITARGGLAALQRRRDEYSVARIVHHDVHTTEVLYRTWTMEPDCFRQDTLQGGLILKSQQYDGKDFVEGYPGHVRFGLEKDLDSLLETLELNRIFSLLCINTGPYPARLGKRVRDGGKWLQEVVVQAPSGLTYRIFFDEESDLIARMEYLERTRYAGTEEACPIVTCIDSYRPVDGLLVADRLRIFSRGDLKAEVRLLEHRINVGLSADFFSIGRLRQDLEANRSERRKIAGTGSAEQEWRASAYRKIHERLQTHRNRRFREAASYGDARRYRERLFESGLSLVVRPEYLAEDDALAFYAEFLPAPSGFYEDCIVLAAPPKSPSVSAEVLLHETTHAILRRGQEKAPLRIADDEFLAYYQGSLFSIGNLLEAFEQIAFDGKPSKEPRAAERATRIWREAEGNLEQTRRDNRITREALEQFREWCGVDFDLPRIRRHYIELGVDPNWMPLETGPEGMNPGQNQVLEHASQQPAGPASHPPLT